MYSHHTNQSRQTEITSKFSTLLFYRQPPYLFSTRFLLNGWCNTRTRKTAFPWHWQKEMWLRSCLSRLYISCSCSTVKTQPDPEREKINGWKSWAPANTFTKHFRAIFPLQELYYRSHRDFIMAEIVGLSLSFYSGKRNSSVSAGSWAKLRMQTSGFLETIHNSHKQSKFLSQLVLHA